jgi:hypothetical protein
MVEVIERLSSSLKALSSNPNTTKRSLANVPQAQSLMPRKGKSMTQHADGGINSDPAQEISVTRE